MTHVTTKYILTQERTVTQHVTMAATTSCSMGGIISNTRDILLKVEAVIIILTTMMVTGAEGLVVVARLMVIVGVMDVAVEAGAVVRRGVEVQVGEEAAVLVAAETVVCLLGTDLWTTMAQAPGAMMEDPKREVLRGLVSQL
jgi:hypothetical protein